MNCIDGEDCFLFCDETNCQNSIINCPKTRHSCNILCHNSWQRPCLLLTVNASRSNGGILNIRGEGNSSSHILNQAKIICPINGYCNIKCMTENGCDHTDIYSSNGSIITIITNSTWSFQSSIIYLSHHSSINLICDGYLSCADTIIGRKKYFSLFFLL